MPELARIQARLKTVQTLLGLVKNVKALAAVGVKEMHHTAANLAQVESHLLDGLSQVATGVDPAQNQVRKSRQTAVIAIGSDQGLCGPFNQRLMAVLPPPLGPTVVVGYRLARELERENHAVEEVHSIPQTSDGTRQLLSRLLEAIQVWQEEGVERIDVTYHMAKHPGLDYGPVRQTLLPLDQNWWKGLAARSWPGRVHPLILGCSRESFRSILQDWLYIALHKCLTESRHAESGARLMAMQVAEKGILEQLQSLEKQFRESRQAVIDSEILDISSGYEALTKDK